MKTFIYCPLSGDRVFAQKEAPGITVKLLENNSRVVEGDYAELIYYTAAPRCWWRDVARLVAKQIVEAVGGLAWDNQGSIHLIVPLSVAIDVAGIMEAVGGEDLQWEDRVRLASGDKITAQEGRLLRAGVLRVGLEGGSLAIQAPQLQPPVPEWKKVKGVEEVETTE